MSTITFYLIRHGDKVKDIGDIGLTDLGRKQAYLTGKFLKNKHIEHIITSPLKRAVETAEIISDILGLECEKNEGLKERMSYGDIKKQSYSEYVRLCSLSVKNRGYVLPNGVSSISAGKRIEKFLAHFINGPFKNIVLISHGGIIGDYLRNVFSEKILREFSASFLRKLQVDSCSITKIEYKNQKFHLKQLDLTTHLNIKK